MLVVLHLLFSLWMYSDESVFYSESLDPRNTQLFGVPTGVSADEQERRVDAWLDDANSGSLQGLDLGRRLLRINTIPIVVLSGVLCAVCVTAWLLNTVLGNLILRPFKACCMRFCCSCLVRHCACCQAVRREFNPPLTEHFLKVVRRRTGKKAGDPVADPKAAAASLSDVERHDGWRVRHDKSGTGNYYKCRVWSKGGLSHGRRHEPGDLYYTYETMDETGIPSYAIADNPDYKVAMSAQLTAEHSSNALHKALGKAKLGVRLKGGIMAGILEKQAAAAAKAGPAKPKTKMVHKYAVAASYKETHGGAPPVGGQGADANV